MMCLLLSRRPFKVALADYIESAGSAANHEIICRTRTQRGTRTAGR